MPAVMRVCAEVVKAGVPAIAIGGEGFERMGRAIAKGLAIPHVPIVMYPGGILSDDEETFRAKTLEMGARIVRELTGEGLERDAAADAGEARPYRQRSIVVAGTLDQVQDGFEQRTWTDGLPIVPPTLARVEAFLAHTSRAPDEVIGILAPSQREATVWNVAVNGVMAGCRPEYLPVLLAAVDAMADEDFRIEDAGSTPGWEPMVTVSGPLVKGLGFNAGVGVLRAGRRANTSVGRFMRLYLRNVPGFHIPPGDTDMGAIATTFNVALAEDDDALTEIGWTPHRVERGFGLQDTVVTVRSVVTISAPIYSGGSRAADHLATISHVFGEAIGSWFYLALLTGSWHPMVVMTPYVAKAIAKDGLSKDDVREYLFRNTKVRAGDMDDYAWQVGSTDFSVAQAIQDRQLGPEWQGDDPERRVPVLLRPEWTDIIVAGNPGRNQSRGYVGNHAQGVPVTKLVEAPPFR